LNVPAASSYRSLVAAPYFLHILVANPAKAKRLRSYKLLTSRPALRLLFLPADANPKSVQLPRHVAAAKETLDCHSHTATTLVGRLGFEPRQSAPKALDLPLVDRPTGCWRRGGYRRPAGGFAGQRYASSHIVRQYSWRGKVSVSSATMPRSRRRNAARSAAT
jgi:hypothetical protein